MAGVALVLAHWLEADTLDWVLLVAVESTQICGVMWRVSSCDFGSAPPVSSVTSSSSVSSRPKSGSDSFRLSSESSPLAAAADGRSASGLIGNWSGRLLVNFTGLGRRLPPRSWVY